MTRATLFRNLRTLLFLLGLGALIAAPVSLWWVNRSGLPDSWRAALEREMAKHGMHVTIGGLTYRPLHGIMASEVRIFADETKRRELSRLERIVIAVDKTKLARGEFRLLRVELGDARLVLPVDPDDPASPALEITGLSGTANMPGGHLFELRGVRGRVGGVDVWLDGRMAGRQAPSEELDDPAEGIRRALLAKLIDGIGQWTFPEDARPVLRLSVEGNVAERSGLVARVSFRAAELRRAGHPLRDVAIEGELHGNLLTLTSLRARDSYGELEGRLDYDLLAREGRFDIASTLDAMVLAREWLGLPEVPELALGGEQWIVSEGGFSLPPDAPPEIRATGKIRCEMVSVREMPFDHVESLFSWRDGALYLRDMRAVRPDGEARGKLMFQPPLVRLALHTSLPVTVYRPFFEGRPLGRVLRDFGERDGAAVEVTLDGGFDTTDRHSWAFSGRAAVSNMSYRGVPVRAADCQLALSHHELDFFNGTVEFDYSDYPLRNARGGPDRGTGTVGRIRYEKASKLVRVENVGGTIWPAPMVRFFAPKVADLLEVYRFHAPPRLRASGVVDVTPQGRSALDVGFRSAQAADYTLFGKTLTLTAPAGEVRVRGDHVAVDDLTFRAFGGPVTARFVSHRDGMLEAELSWNRLALAELSATYGSKIQAGQLTGRTELTIQNGRAASVNGRGLLSLEQAELFSVPVFGPLSPLVAGVLGDRRVGFERARNAFCSFSIRDGMLWTEDLYTSTPSLVFTGEGSVDLAEQTLDMTMRMNARGFLGLITLPLRPFYGLFQFRGDGPLAAPEWENVRFTSPPAKQNKLLLGDPPKALIVDEP